jgi:hypothetical protein
MATKRRHTSLASSVSKRRLAAAKEDRVGDFTMLFPPDMRQDFFARHLLYHERLVLRHVCKRWAQILPVTSKLDRWALTVTLAEMGYKALWKWAVRVGYSYNMASAYAAISNGRLPLVLHIQRHLDKLFSDASDRGGFFNGTLILAILSDDVPTFEWAMGWGQESAVNTFPRLLGYRCEHEERFGNWFYALETKSLNILEHLLRFNRPCACPGHQISYYRHLMRDYTLMTRDMFEWLYERGFRHLPSSLHDDVIPRFYNNIEEAARVITWLRMHGCRPSAELKRKLGHYHELWPALTRRL